MKRKKIENLSPVVLTNTKCPFEQRNAFFGWMLNRLNDVIFVGILLWKGH